MKPETLALFKKHLDDGKFEIEGNAFNYDLSDDEVAEIVFAEYGTSVHQSIPALFEVIVKKLFKLGVEHAKAGSDNATDK